MAIALLLHFPFPGPWGKDLTDASRELARDIAVEDGLLWKIWLENRETARAGGFYLFVDSALAGLFREKHERRLAALGLTGVEGEAFEVNPGLSALTKAGAALAGPLPVKRPSMGTVTIPS
jgi:Putative mono-oxygenase ydhR